MRTIAYCLLLPIVLAHLCGVDYGRDNMSNSIMIIWLWWQFWENTLQRVYVCCIYYGGSSFILYYISFVIPWYMIHVPGALNTTADMLSSVPINSPSFLVPLQHYSDNCLQPPGSGFPRLDPQRLDRQVSVLLGQGITPSTASTYRSGVRRNAKRAEKCRREKPSVRRKETKRESQEEYKRKQLE